MKKSVKRLHLTRETLADLQGAASLAAQGPRQQDLTMSTCSCVTCRPDSCETAQTALLD